MITAFVMYIALGAFAAVLAGRLGYVGFWSAWTRSKRVCSRADACS